MFKDDELQQKLQKAMDNYVKLDLLRVKEYNELVDKYKAKEQECEKLKKQYNCNACGTCKGKEDYKNMQRHCKNAIAQNHKYKQAFDEIERLIQVNKKELNETLYHDYDDQILNIINKAKEDR